MSQPEPDRASIKPVEAIECILDGYQSLRAQCVAAMEAHPEATLGADAWLVAVIDDTDISNMSMTVDGIRGNGSTYTSRTMEHEPFGFLVRWDMLDLSGPLFAGAPLAPEADMAGGPAGVDSDDQNAAEHAAYTRARTAPYAADRL